MSYIKFLPQNTETHTFRVFMYAGACAQGFIVFSGTVILWSGTKNGGKE